MAPQVQEQLSEVFYWHAGVHFMRLGLHYQICMFADNVARLNVKRHLISLLRFG